MSGLRQTIAGTVQFTYWSAARILRLVRSSHRVWLVIVALVLCALFHRTAGIAIAAEPAATGLQFRLVAEPDDPSKVDEMPDSSGGKPLRILKTVALDGHDVARVYATTTQSGAAVGMDFSPEGGKKLEQVTKDNINHRIAIILNGKVLSAPTIKSPISKLVVVTGGKSEFTAEKVKALVDSINTSLKDAKPEKAE
jgi:preprotein translocase subunit SecD